MHYGPGDHTLTLKSGGVTRSLVLHVPPNPPLARRALILVYHGHGGTAQGTAQGTDFEQVADSTGEVVAFLQGLNNRWNEDAFGPSKPNDVAYTAAVIALLERVVPFDHARIVAAGFSNGALMAEDLGCKLAGRLAMIVPVEGELAVSQSADCAPSRPISVYEVHGTADAAIPYNGGQSGGPPVLSAPRSVARWAQLDHCSRAPKFAHPNGSVKLTLYANCHQRVVVTLRTIYGGVHEWGNEIGLIVYHALPR